MNEIERPYSAAFYCRTSTTGCHRCRTNPCGHNGGRSDRYRVEGRESQTRPCTQMRNAKASCCCGGTSYAAVGLTLSELVRDAENFQGRHLLAHCLNVRLRGRMFRTLSKLSGLIPERLAQLDSATFDRLHHSVRGIGVACHDVVSGRPCYFATGADCGLRLSDAVRASASIPGARCMASRASRPSRS